MKKLLEEGKCKYSKHLQEFVNADILFRDKNVLIIKDKNYLERFFNKHCKEIIYKYEFLEEKGIYPSELQSLQDAWKLFDFIYKNKIKDCDIRHLSSMLFGDSKTLIKSPTLKKIYNKEIKNDNFNIIHIKSDKNTYLKSINLHDIFTANNFFSLFSTKLNLIKTDAKYVVVFENLYPFFKLKCKDSLFIYSGGFQNISVISNIISEVMHKKNIIHFGDVDQSGLLIADFVLYNNKKASFYPDINTIQIIKEYIDIDLLPEKPYEPNMLKSSELINIAEYMKSNYKYRIEQEKTVSFILEAKIPPPDWCNLIGNL